MSEETAPRMRSMRMNYRADDKTIVEFIEAQEAKSVSLRLLITLFMREHGAQDVTTVVSRVLNNHASNDIHSDRDTESRDTATSTKSTASVESADSAQPDLTHDDTAKAAEADGGAVESDDVTSEAEREAEPAPEHEPKSSAAQAETTPAAEDTDSADKPPKAAARDISEMFK